MLVKKQWHLIMISYKVWDIGRVYKNILKFQASLLGWMVLSDPWNTTFKNPS